MDDAPTPYGWLQPLSDAGLAEPLAREPGAPLDHRECPLQFGLWDAENHAELGFEFLASEGHSLRLRVAQMFGRVQIHLSRELRLVLLSQRRHQLK